MCSRLLANISDKCMLLLKISQASDTACSADADILTHTHIAYKPKNLG